MEDSEHPVAASAQYDSEAERAFYEGFKSLDDPDAPPGVIRLRTPETELYRALLEIAELESFTATPTQFYKHLQRIARRALAEYAAAKRP